MRDTVYPIGVHLATLFGFQMRQAASPAPSAADASTAATAADAHSVPSNLDNQVDHLSQPHQDPTPTLTLPLTLSLTLT